MKTRAIAIGMLLFMVVYLLLGAYQVQESQKSKAALLDAIGKYKKHHADWPTASTQLAPYLSSPATAVSINPTFRPVSNDEAYVEANEFFFMATRRFSGT